MSALFPMWRESGARFSSPRRIGPYMNEPKDTMGIVVQAVGDFLSDIAK
jgi:hypothetical protein